MRSVLITGTSKGIGYETALAFARAGYHVHATMRNPSTSPALTEIAMKEKLPITVTAMDVDKDKSVRAAMADIQAQHGPVDVLVNNAGIECFGSIEELSIDDFRAVMEGNAGAGQSSTSARWRERSAIHRRRRIALQSGRSRP